MFPRVSFRVKSMAFAPSASPTFPKPVELLAWQPRFKALDNAGWFASTTAGVINVFSLGNDSVVVGEIDDGLQTASSSIARKQATIATNFAVIVFHMKITTRLICRNEL